MLRCSGSGQYPGSSVLDELQLSNGLLWKAGEETITLIHPAGDKGMDMFPDWKQNTLQCFWDDSMLI